MIVFALNNQTSADDYTAANTLECPQAIKVNLTIANTAVYMQFSGTAPGVAPGGSAFGPPRLFVPGFHNMVRRTDRVRFKSAVAGQPAQVTIEALTADD